MLTVIPVRLVYGRSGSTLLMSLLGTSPEVLVGSAYPFEDRYLHRFLVHAGDLAGRTVRPVPASMRERVAWRVAPPPAVRVGLDFTPTLIDVERFSADLLCDYWQRFSAGAVDRCPAARLYAEKMSPRQVDDLARLDGIPLRPIRLVRDPRDAWASVNAFDQRRGFYGFGRRAGQSRSAFLDEWVARAASTYEQVAGEPGVVVRYEDLVTEIDDVARVVESAIGTRLDPSRAGRFEAHMTTTPERSIGRWRTDLPADEAETIASRLGRLLDEHGYR